MTANSLDLDAHMNLISKEINVFCLPGFDVIGFDDWFNQCKYEFENKLLKKASYKELNVLAETLDMIMFRPLETGGSGRNGQFRRHRLYYSESR